MNELPESQPFLTSPPPPQRDLRWIFIGPNGLIRAGWGVLLFVIIFIVLEILDGLLLSRVFHMKHSAVLSVRMGLIGEGSQVICIFLATAIMALIERHPVLSYGYQGSARAVRFLSGLAWGFVAVSALVLALWKSHLLAFGGQMLHGEAILKYAVAWGVVFLLVALFEESTLRGYLQFTLTRGMGFWWAALIFSFLFGFAHRTNSGESPVGLVQAGAIGLVFCLSLWYTGSLWWAVGFHAAWDWGESYFYGTSDSGMIARGHLLAGHPLGSKILWNGGTTGPEGSLYGLPLMLITALLMWLWWGRRVTSPFSGSGWRPAWARRPALGSPNPETGRESPGGTIGGGSAGELAR